MDAATGNVNTYEQVALYLSLFDRTASGGTAYLKQCSTWTNPVDRITLTFDLKAQPLAGSLHP